jgi:hypothetical protein
MCQRALKSFSKNLPLILRKVSLFKRKKKKLLHKKKKKRPRQRKARKRRP